LALRRLGETEYLGSVAVHVPAVPAIRDKGMKKITDWVTPKYLERNQSQCQFVKHKPQMNCPRIKYGLIKIDG
jgi:hypothetical protein